MFILLQTRHSIQAMGQVRDNGKVCRLAVPPGVFALSNRGVGKSRQFSHRIQTPGGTPPRAATLRAINIARRPKTAPDLTLNNSRSRQITVNGVERHSQSRCGIARRVAVATASNYASFSKIAHQPFATADQVHQGKSRLIPVNSASQIFRLPKINPPLPPSQPTRQSRFHDRGIARKVAAPATGLHGQSRWITVDNGGSHLFFPNSPPVPTFVERRANPTSAQRAVVKAARKVTASNPGKSC